MPVFSIPQLTLCQVLFSPVQTHKPTSIIEAGLVSPYSNGKTLGRQKKFSKYNSAMGLS